MNNSTDRSRRILLGSVWLVTLFLYILFQCVSPLLPLLIVEFHLDHWMGGFLYTLPVLMIALFSYPLGVVSDRMGLELAVGCGATVAVLSSLARPWATNYFMLAVSLNSHVWSWPWLGWSRQVFLMCYTWSDLDARQPRFIKEDIPRNSYARSLVECSRRPETSAMISSPAEATEPGEKG